MRQPDYERAADDLARHMADERRLIATERRPARVQMRLARLAVLGTLARRLRGRVPPR